MPFRLGRSKGLRGLAFGLVVLGCCVFGWGLRYKLSLYDPPHSIDRRMPEAKLLSGKECGEFAVIHVRPAVRTDLPLALTTVALAFVLFRGSQLWSGWQSAGVARPLSRHAPQSVLRLSFSIRPPPLRH
ncbi:MAG TPA: hypothetical protein VGG42_05050 [Acidobacteriaceae bacterium]